MSAIAPDTRPVNIVMLARNREKLTYQALTTLARNTPIHSYNLTLVDDESTRSITDWHEFRGTTAHVGWVPINHTVIRIEKSRSVTGMARNLGVYWAEKYWGRGRYLYLSDNDVYFTPGWLETLIDTIEDPRAFPACRLVGGWNHPFLGPYNILEWNDKKRQVITHDAVAGASQLMSWQTWDTFGPLDAHAPGVGQSEDWKFCQDTKRQYVNGHPVSVASVKPHVVFNCGVTNSYGKPSPGAEMMITELKEAQKKYPDLYYE